jgi:hypothetical protein
MHSRFAAVIFLFAAAAEPVGAHAMIAATHGPSGRCRIVAGEKLPARLGGGSALCAEVERAIAKVAPNARYSAEVKVISPSRLAAAVIVNGRMLPEQKFAAMDRELDPASIQRFAQALAAEVAKVANP